jgi:hypothetical protein
MNCGRAESDGVYKVFSMSLFNTIVFAGNPSMALLFTCLNAQTMKTKFFSFKVNPPKSIVVFNRYNSAWMAYLCQSKNEIAQGLTLAF